MVTLPKCASDGRPGEPLEAARPDPIRPVDTIDNTTNYTDERYMMTGNVPEVFSPTLLRGKRILITGGGTGLGRGVARHLVEHGAEVHLWGRREAVLAEAAEEASASRPGSVHYHTVDVRDYDNVDAPWAGSGRRTARSPASSTTPPRTSSPRPRT